MHISQSILNLVWKFCILLHLYFRIRIKNLLEMLDLDPYMMNPDPQHSCDKESPPVPDYKEPLRKLAKGWWGGRKRQHRAMTTSWQWQKSTDRKLPRIWVMHATNKFPLSFTGNSSSYSTTSQTPFHIWERSVHVHKVSVHQVPTGAYIGHTHLHLPVFSQFSVFHCHIIITAVVYGLRGSPCPCMAGSVPDP